MSRKSVINSYELKGDKHFLLPEIESIQQFLESSVFASESPSRLHYPIETLWSPEGFKTLYALAYRPHGKAVASRCSDHTIGRYEVLKGGYPDDLALLRATDRYGIQNVWISLISWSGYQQYLEEALASEEIKEN